MTTMKNDSVSRAAVLRILYRKLSNGFRDYNGDWNEPTINKDAIDEVKELPSAQPNLSEAYSKAVFTWLMDYQIRAAELKGRYTPYEVLSWVINDWRKEDE